MRVLVWGGDGYLGWPTALRFAARGHDVAIVDNYLRRRYDLELGTASLVPLPTLPARVSLWRDLTGGWIDTFVGDLTDADFVTATLRDFAPDTVIHLGEQRSAPYSMLDQAHAVHTQVNNVVGTLNLVWAIAQTDPGIHLIKLGTMGEYGTPNIGLDIEDWTTTPPTSMPTWQGSAEAAPAVPPALHTDLIVVTEAGRAVVPRPHRQEPPPRDPGQRPRPDRQFPDLYRRQHRRPKPYVWTATAGSILAKVARARNSIDQRIRHRVGPGRIRWPT